MTSPYGEPTPPPTSGPPTAPPAFGPQGRAYGAPGLPTSPPPSRPPDLRAQLPGRAALIGVGGFLASGVLGGVGAVAVQAVAPTLRTVILLVSQLLLWAGLLGTCWLVSRLYGTGSLRRDYGLALRASDVAAGFGVSIVDRIASLIVAIVLMHVSNRLVGSNTDVFRALEHDRAATLTLAAAAVIGAPIVEELFFRGLMQRSLEPAVGIAGAVVLQGLMFGMAHASAGLGAANTSLILGLAIVGMIHGLTVARTRRLGIAMWTHAFFNLATLVYLASTTG